MKWLLVWTAIIGGQAVNVTDEDNPDVFNSVYECAAQVQLLAPQIDALIRKHSVPNFETVIGQCVMIEDDQPEGLPNDEG